MVMIKNCGKFLSAHDWRLCVRGLIPLILFKCHGRHEIHVIRCSHTESIHSKQILELYAFHIQENQGTWVYIQ